MAAVNIKLLRFKYFLVFATVVDVVVNAIGIFVLLQEVRLLLPLPCAVVVAIEAEAEAEADTVAVCCFDLMPQSVSLSWVLERP